MDIKHNSNIEVTFEDIIQKARQIKERKFREQCTAYITAYSATGCAVGILGTFMVIIFLAYQCSWIRTVTDTFITECCAKNKGNKESIPHSSIENKRADESTRQEQSRSSSEVINVRYHEENEEQSNKEEK